uniref:Uncharacterized protein n=1 Tax=Anguilla anguilla TaxID=7936 RepID=A0A0E9V911_ANGAN
MVRFWEKCPTMGSRDRLRNVNIACNSLQL